MTLLEVEVPVGVDPAVYPKADDDYLVVAEEAFSSLDNALTTLDERGIKTDEFNAIWTADNPF